MVKIHIHELKLLAIIGTKPQERQKPQELIVDIVFEYDATQAIRQDDLNQAVDYDHLSKEIITKAQETKFFLIEKFADFILGVILEDKHIQKASVRLTKPQSISAAQGVSVEIEKSRVR